MPPCCSKLCPIIRGDPAGTRVGCAVGTAINNGQLFMHKQSKGESVTDTSLGCLQTCLELGLHGRYLASPASLCKQLFLRALHLRLAFCSVYNPLSHCTASCARQGPTDPSEKKEAEENLISSASEIAWVQSWRISRTLKEFPDLRHLPKLGICLRWTAHIFSAHTVVVHFELLPLSLQGHVLSEWVNETSGESFSLHIPAADQGFI